MVPAAGARTSVLKRILYVDLFLPENSNFHWLRHFRKIGETEAFDIRKNPLDLKKKIFEFRPDHIHLGGSVKNGIVPIGLLDMAKEALGCRITAFYGDAPFSIYHAQMSEIVDRIYISNRTHIQMNRQKGHANFEYMPCPTDPNIFNPRAVEKVYDVCFIGNNNSATRLSLLKRIATRFDLVVAGNGWSGTGLKEIGTVYGEQFSEICSKSRILIGLIRDGWAGLEAYFSNRTVNVLATGSFLIQRYSPGLETVFENQRDMVWYRSENELFEQIDYFLDHSEERERIGLKGREKVLRRYTYSISISRILDGVGGADRLQGKKNRNFNSSNDLKLHIGYGNNLLSGYVNIDKYNLLTDRQLDAARLDYEDNSVEEIFTSHMIEHVPVIENGDILCRAVKPSKSEINVSRTDPSKAKSQAVRLDQPWIRAIDEAKTGRRFSMEWYLKHPITTALMNSPVLAGIVLDIGCGTGERTFIAQRHAGCTIDGIDVSAVAVGQAQNRFGSHALNFLQGDITALPFQDCAFDNAFMLAVIEHVTDTATLMQEIRRVVKPGGKVFVTVTENDYYHASPDHVHVFSKETLVRTFSGFKVLDCYVEKNIIFLTAESPIKAKSAKEGECPICSMSMMAPVIKDMLYCRNCGLFKKQRLPSTEAVKAALKDFTIASLTSKERAVQKINLVYEQMTWFMERIPTRGKLFDVGASGGFMMAVGS